MSNTIHGIVVDDTYLDDDESTGLISGRMPRNRRTKAAARALARGIFFPGSNALILAAKVLKAKRLQARKNKAIVAVRSAMRNAEVRKKIPEILPDNEPEEMPESAIEEIVQPGIEQLPENQVEEISEQEQVEDMSGINKKVMLYGSAGIIALIGFYAYKKGWLK